MDKRQKEKQTNKKTVIIAITALKIIHLQAVISRELNKLRGLRLTDLSLVVAHLAITCEAEKKNMATESFLRSVTCN